MRPAFLFCAMVAF